MATLSDHGIPSVGLGLLLPYRFGEAEAVYQRRCELAPEFYRLDRIAQEQGQPNGYQRRLLQTPLTEYERLTWQVQDTYAAVCSFDEAKKALLQ